MSATTRSPMIYLSGHEHIPVAPGRAPARLFDLSRVEVLGAANLAALGGNPNRGRLR